MFLYVCASYDCYSPSNMSPTGTFRANCIEVRAAGVIYYLEIFNLSPSRYLKKIELGAFRKVLQL